MAQQSQAVAATAAAVAVAFAVAMASPKGGGGAERAPVAPIAAACCIRLKGACHGCSTSLHTVAHMTGRT
jgi:Fe-S cluster biogenesis protein NfuA